MVWREVRRQGRSPLVFGDRVAPNPIDTTRIRGHSHPGARRRRDRSHLSPDYRKLPVVRGRRVQHLLAPRLRSNSATALPLRKVQGPGPVTAITVKPAPGPQHGPTPPLVANMGRGASVYGPNISTTI